VSLYGFPRVTADLDVTIDLGDVAPLALIASLRKAGFTPRFDDEAFIEAARVIPVVHDASAFPIDLVLAGEGLEQRFLNETVSARVSGIAIPVLSPENLVVTKLLAGRPKDLEDVRELAAMRELDHAKIDALLELLEEALDQADLRPLYARLRRN